MHHAALNRPRPHDRHFDDEIVETLRFQARQHGHLSARLDLKHADGIGPAEHRVNGRIFARDVLHAEGPAQAARDSVERAANRGEHPERQHVDLHQPERVDVVLVPLDDAAPRHRGILDRHQPVETPPADDEAADVLREMAREATQFFGKEQPLLDAWAARVEASLGETRRQLLALVPPGQRRSQRVDTVDVDAECATGIAQRRACAVADDRRRQRGTLAAVFAVDVLDDFLAPLVLEVDVDIGGLITFARDESPEQQLRLRRINLGNAECVTHRRIGRRTPPLAQDALPARELDDVMDGEEVGLVAQFGDQFELLPDLLRHFVWHAARIAHLKPLLDLGAQIGGRRLAGRHDLLGVFVAQFVERETAEAGNAHRLGEQFRRIELRQPQPRAQMPFAVGEQRMPRRIDRHIQAQRRQGVLQRPSAAHVHVHVAGRHQRQVGGGREHGQRGKPFVVVRGQMAFAGNPAACRKRRRQPAAILGFRLRRRDP